MFYVFNDVFLVKQLMEGGFMKVGETQRDNSALAAFLNSAVVQRYDHRKTTTIKSAH